MLKVIQGDCVERLRELPDGSVQCCVTSPPYWGLRDYGHANQIGLEETPHAYVETMLQVFAEVWRVLKDDGTLWLNLGDSYAAQRGGSAMPAETLAGGISGRGDKDAKRGRESAYCPSRNAASFGLKHKDLIGIPWRVALALQADGWFLRSDIIWAKSNCMPESVTDRPTRSHEYIFLLTKQARYYYDHEAIKEPASEFDWESRLDRATDNNKLHPTEKLNGIRTRPDKQRGHSRRHAGFNDRWDAMEKTEQCSSMRNKRDVWTIAPANYREAHFATFPTDLIKPCIMAGTKPGDVVLDPFGGSGTTGQVALELGRKAILIELNPEYIALIEKRTHVTPGFNF